MWLKKVVFHNYFFIAVILSILTAIGIFLLKGFLPPVVPVFYGRPTGSEQLVSFWYLFLIPGLSIVITFVNLFINTAIDDAFIKRVLAVAALIVSLMSTVTIVKIVLLVGFL